MANKYSFLKDTIVGRKSKDYLVPGSSAAKQYNKMYGPTPTQQKKYMNEAIASSLMVGGLNTPRVGKINMPGTIGRIQNTLAKYGGKIYNWKTALGISALGAGTKAIGGAKDFYEENKEKPDVPENTKQPDPVVPTYTPSGPSDAGGKVYGTSGGSNVDLYKDRKPDDIAIPGKLPAEPGKKYTAEELKVIMKKVNPGAMGIEEYKTWKNIINDYAGTKGYEPKPVNEIKRKDIETFKTKLPKEELEKLVTKYKSINI